MLPKFWQQQKEKVNRGDYWPFALSCSLQLFFPSDIAWSEWGNFGHNQFWPQNKKTVKGPECFGLLLGPAPSNWHTAASTAGLTRGMCTMGGPRGKRGGPRGGGTPEDDWSPPVCGQHTLLTATANGDGGLWILLKILTLMGLCPIAKLACRGQQNKIFKGQ